MTRLAAASAPLTIEVSFTSRVRSTPFTGRILVFTGRASGKAPRFGLDWFQPQPLYAIDVENLVVGQTAVLDDRALGVPTPPGELPGRPTRFQAVLDQVLDTWEIGTAPGNGISPSVRVDGSTGPVRLVIDRLIPRPRFRENSQVKRVRLRSRLLTQFFQRPIYLQAGVVLPEGYMEAPERRYAVLYLIPGFGGDHLWAFYVADNWPDLHSKSGPNLIVVVLDPTAHWGHHGFADSANNGPVGTALVTEMLPYIDRTFRTVADPRARLLTGHSSGGWSALWLQCRYPDLFGGAWSTSPDPVDFRDFQQVDLYAAGANLFIDHQGQPRPLARDGTRPVAFFRSVSDIEAVLGRGGPLRSFEAIFGPRGPDGRPQLLYDRSTGVIDPATARAWSRYDISRCLAQDWDILRPKLAGKLHVYVGALDTFYLEGAVRLLKRSLEARGSDAVIEIRPGKDHETLLDSDMEARIAREMAANRPYSLIL